MMGVRELKSLHVPDLFAAGTSHCSFGLFVENGSIFTCFPDGRLLRLDLATGRVLDVFHLTTDCEIDAAAFSRSSHAGISLAAFKNRGTESVVEIWKKNSSWVRAGEFRDVSPTSRRIEFLEDGRLLAGFDTNDEVCIWDISSGRRVCKISREADETCHFAGSPNLRRMVLLRSGPSCLTPGAPNQSKRKTSNALQVSSYSYAEDGALLDSRHATLFGPIFGHPEYSADGAFFCFQIGNVIMKVDGMGAGGMSSSAGVLLDEGMKVSRLLANPAIPTLFAGVLSGAQVILLDLRRHRVVWHETSMVSQATVAWDRTGQILAALSPEGQAVRMWNLVE